MTELSDVELLYALDRTAWGRGLATEAAGAALAYGFEVAGLGRIIGITRPANAASRRILEKLGMRYEREVEIFGIEAVLYGLSRERFTGA